MDDIVHLDAISPGAVLSTVKQRYERQEIYTNVAQIVIAMNPFENLPIYTASHMKKYMASPDVAQERPHIFSIGNL